MIESKNFKQKSFYNKLKTSLLTLPIEKAFYLGLVVLLGLISLFLIIFLILKQKTVKVPTYNTTLSIATTDTVKYLIPMYASNETEKMLSSLLYSGLKRKNIDGKYVYELAENITPDTSGLNLNIKLKSDLKFSDGSYITSDDVIYTYSLLSSPIVKSVDRVKFEGISLKKVDDLNLIMTFKKAFIDLDSILSIGIVSKTQIESENLENLSLSDLSIWANSSGPYYLQTFTVDGNNVGQVSLRANTYYTNNIPFNRYINFYVYNDSESIKKDLDLGKIDVVLDTYKNLTTDENLLPTNFSLYKYLLPRISAIYLNETKRNEFAKRENRLAIYNSVDRNVLVKNVLVNNATPTFDLTPGSKLKQTISTSSNSINNKVELLISSSTLMSSFATVTLTVLNSERQIAGAKFIKESLKNKLGLEIILKPLEQIQLSDVIKNRDYEMLMYTTEIETIPDLYAFWHSSQRNAPGLNFSSYTSKVFDSSLESIKDSSNTETINTAIENMRQEFYVEYPYIPLYSSYKFVAVSKDISFLLPQQINSSRDITSGIKGWYKKTERVWPYLQNENIINKIYKLLH